MKKKLLIGVLVIGFCFSCVSCGSNTEKEDNSAVTQEETSEASDNEESSIDLSSFSSACTSVGIDEFNIEDYFDMDGIITFTYDEKSFSCTLNDDGSVNTLWYGDSGSAEKWLIEDGNFVSTLK